MKNFLTGFLIALLIGISFGYFWAWKALTRTYEVKLEQKDKIIQNYRATWTPIRDYKQAPVRQRVK